MAATAESSRATPPLPAERNFPPAFPPSRNLDGLVVPHPFPYQGSKRGIAGRILPYFPRTVGRLIEPFCGSGAISLAAASCGLARSFWLNDVNEPLMRLWVEILEHPDELASDYEKLWRRQGANRKDFFFRARSEFNRSRQPHHLLYLLARIVKGSVRYGQDGRFNQSPDNRRAGMRPSTMRRRLIGVADRLGGVTTLTASDYRMVTTRAQAPDLVYLDPPYQGTSHSRDRRYCSGVPYEELEESLHGMNTAGISFIVSYDGRTGDKTHGKPLPEHLSLHKIPIHAGVSSQSVLLGTAAETVESLYLSPALRNRPRIEKREHLGMETDQPRSLFA